MDSCNRATNSVLAKIYSEDGPAGVKITIFYGMTMYLRKYGQNCRVCVTENNLRSHVPTRTEANR